MFEQFFRRRHVRRRLEGNVLAGPLRELVEHLARRGHTPLTIQSYLQAAEHFGRWVRRTDRTLAEVNATTVQVFLTRHLPHCQCPSLHARTVPVVRAALRQLLAVRPRPAGAAQPPTPIDQGIAAFEAHLRDTCGLTPATRRYYLRYVRELLVTRFGTGPVDLAALTLRDVVAFVRAQAAHLAPASANTVATGVRSFLRYLQLRGLGDARWAAAVPRAACWRLAALPRVLRDEQLQAFLAAFDRATGTGRRDYAIAVCFTALGLRASEVAQLSLDALDWRARTLTLAPGKSRRVDRLPLPAPVAAALAAYLRDGRPPTTAREVFVHHRA
ncbi:MAG: tyrosine-type recombinase/integrase, partial [Gemmatimonadales bacterium]